MDWIRDHLWESWLALSIVLGVAEMFSPDLILAEARLPDIEGADLLARLKAHPRAAGAFLFTMSADTADVRAGLCGVEIHGRLAKPLCRESLMRLVEAVAWSRSATAAVAEADRPVRSAA